MDIIIVSFVDVMHSVYEWVCLSIDFKYIGSKLLTHVLLAGINMTFEDRRKENFEKGQAELERRRAMLREQQQKEAEARLAAEKAEQEKRERIRYVAVINILLDTNTQ